MRRNKEENSQGGRPTSGTPVLVLLDCETVLLRKRAAALLRHPLKAYTRFASVRFQWVR